VGLLLYMALAVAFASFLLYQAIFLGLREFEKAAVGALIAVIGTGLTALGALFAALRQAAVAKEIEDFRKQSATELATLTATLTRDSERMKADSAESLERLKAALNISATAYREIVGAASTYFYALRSAAQGFWNEETLTKAQALMVDAVRYLIHVDQQMQDVWLEFWQEAQYIQREAEGINEEKRRAKSLTELIEEPVEDGSSRRNLRDRYHSVQATASKALEHVETRSD
jgi:uncharacterized membrane protein YccC